MRMLRWAGWVGLGLGLMFAGSVRWGAALQRSGGSGSGGGSGSTGGSSISSAPSMNSPSNYPASNGPFGMAGAAGMDSEVRRNLEERRGRLVNLERQRIMQKEASDLIRVAAELQQSVSKEPQGQAREEALRRAELVEKLAHDVKERMKGSR